MELILVLGGIAIALIFSAVGWAAKHAFLKRHNQLLQKKYDDLYTLHANQQQEASTSRQKFYEHQLEIKDLTSKIRNLELDLSNSNQCLENISFLKKKSDEMSKENEELKTDFTKYQNENFDYLEKINQMQTVIESLQRQNNQLTSENSKYKRTDDAQKTEMSALKSENMHLKAVLTSQKQSEEVVTPLTPIFPPASSEAKKSNTETSRSDVQSTERFRAKQEAAKAKLKEKANITSTDIRKLKEIVKELEKPKFF